MKRHEKPGCPGWGAAPRSKQRRLASVSTVTMKTAVGSGAPTPGAMPTIFWVSALFLSFLGESKFRSFLN